MESVTTIANKTKAHNLNNLTIFRIISKYPFNYHGVSNSVAKIVQIERKTKLMSEFLRQTC